MSRPNVLFLMTDHTNAQALTPGSQCQTPNLDALATQGTRFERCYTTNAICSPARASLMTGLYPSAHGMWDCTHTQRTEWLDVRSHLRYWSQTFEQAGYRMGYFGKWHVEQSKQLERFGWATHDARAVSARPEPIEGTEVIVKHPGYRDYLLAAIGRDNGAVLQHPAFDNGIDFLREQANDQRPFCCFVSAAEPHDPYIPPKRFFDLYDLDRIELSPTLCDELHGKPEVLKRMQSLWSGLSQVQWRTMAAAYWAVISYIDYEVGRILEVLKETGLDRNTIVVFTSDHGDMLGAHGLVTKGVGTAYEEVYNIPLILRVPGMQGGVLDRQTRTSLVDLAPTLLDLAGLDPIPNCQGRSLRPVLDGTAGPSDWLDAYAEFYSQRLFYTQRIVWHDDWKFIFSPGGIDELYNLAQDPHEQRNLAQDPGARGQLVDMTRRMWRKMEEIGDDSLLNTHYATLRTAAVGPNA